MCKTLITAVSKDITTHKKSSNLNGESFNIFSILRARRDEVNTHSRFIFELLNPNGSHGEKGKFSELLVKTICPDLSHHPEPDEVFREDKTSNGKRIDFTIRSTGNYILGIEMKIDAADQPKQLYSYNEELLRRKDVHEAHRLIYLTLDGEAASEASLNYKAIDYQQMSFKFDVIDWLKKCILETKKIELIAAIKQYIRLIESITGISHTMTQQISEKIISSKESFNSSLAIERTLKQSKAELQIRFWNEVIRQLEKTGDKPDLFHTKKVKKTKNSYEKLAHNYYQKKKNNKPIILKISILSAYIESKKCHFYFYLRLWDAIHYGIVIENTSEKIIDLSSKSEWQNEYRNFSSFQHAKAAKATDWLMSFYNTNGEEAINLLKFNEHAQNILFDEKLLSEEVASIIKHKEEMVTFIHSKFESDNIE